MSISKLNSKAWADISKISNVTKSGISYIDGIAVPASDFNPYAMDLDGSTEYFEIATASDRGIANSRSIAWWANYDALTGIMFDMRPTSGTGNIIAIEGSGGPVTIHRVSIFKSTGATLKDWWSFGTPSTGVRMCLIVTRDGTNLKIYLDGVEDTVGTKSTDSTGSMTNTNRRLSFGTNLAHTNFLDGKLSCMAIWNTAMDADAAAVIGGTGGYNFDWGSDNGNYDISANLVHYYRFGADTSAPGADYKGSLNFTSVNVTGADQVPF